MTDDLAAQIAALSDEDAVAVLAVVLNEHETTMARLKELEAAEQVVAQALPQADFVDPVVVEKVAAAGDAPSGGELARATLRYLAIEDETTVAHALEAAPPILHRELLLTLGVGGLVLAALARTGVKLERDKQRRWSFVFEIKPMKDSVVVGLIKQLFEYSLGSK